MQNDGCFIINWFKLFIPPHAPFSVHGSLVQFPALARKLHQSIHHSPKKKVFGIEVTILDANLQGVKLFQ